MNSPAAQKYYNMFFQGNTEGQWFQAQDWQYKAVENIGASGIFNFVDHAKMKYFLIPFRYCEMISKELTNHEDKIPSFDDSSEDNPEEINEILNKIRSDIFNLISCDSKLKTTNFEYETIQCDMRSLIEDEIIPSVFSFSGKKINQEMYKSLKAIDRVLDIFIHKNNKNSLMDIDILTSVCVVKKAIVDVLKMNNKDTSMGGYIINLKTNRVRVYFFSNVDVEHIHLNIPNTILSDEGIFDINGMRNFPTIGNSHVDENFNILLTRISKAQDTPLGSSMVAPVTPPPAIPPVAPPPVIPPAPTSIFDVIVESP